MSKLGLAFLLAFNLFYVGCATVIKGSQQAVTFNSVPEGADIVVEGNIMGKTPATINLKKNQYKHIELRKEGYESVVVPLSTAYDATAILNVFWDSSTTDLATGNAFEYSPNIYNVRLKKIENTEKK